MRVFRLAGTDEAVAVAVRFAFGLDGAVLDAVLREFVRQLLHDAFGVAHAEVARDDDMAGERVQAAGNRPQVQVMYGDDAIGGAQGGEQPRLINMRRAAFHQDVQRAFQHAVAAFANQCGISRLATGSAQRQPKASISSAASIAPTEPSRSPKTCR